jgi:pyridinium-3,5-biscarboxylic acid mononucleotide sulfurtransferase
VTATAPAFPVPTPPDAAAKEGQLGDWLRARGSVLVGYSGGVDSTYLACVAAEVLGRPRVLAVIGRSPSYPAEQWERARAIADRLSIPVLEIETSELADARYVANPSNRCFFCKNELWGRLAPIAAERRLGAVVDGTNADDLRDHRPGALAARQHGVESPLAAAGLTKAEIRERSRLRDLPTWALPSSPCLASRIPYGSPVTVARLRRIEQAELALRTLGIGGDLRVRDHGDLARIELAREALDYWLAPTRRARLAAALRDAGYATVAVDLAGFRSGSLNVLAGVRAD